MEPFRYRIVTEWSSEDEAYIARVPALPGCAAHGESAHEAAQEAQVAAEGILAAMADHGQPAPAEDAAAEYSGQLRLRLPKSLHERISRLANLDEVSINSMLLVLIGKGLGDREARDEAVEPRARPTRRPPIRTGVTRIADAEPAKRKGKAG